MKSLAHSSPSSAPAPIADMQRLHQAGYSLVPLGGGSDGKSPLVKFQGRKRLPLGLTIKRMSDASSAMYGIRLDGIVVIDCDTDNDETRELVERRFGLSPFSAKTPRGRHYYFAANGKIATHQIREGAVAIDIKAGGSSYVAGPGSIRPDGGAYVADHGTLPAASRLPLFEDRSLTAAPLEAEATRPARSKVPVGSRYTVLRQKARAMVEMVNDCDELVAALSAFASQRFDSPETYCFTDIERLARWIWNKRLNNELWGSGMGATKVYHHEFDTLVAQRNGSDAIALLHVIRRNHASIRGKRFALATTEMARASVVPGWSASRFHRAKEALLSAGAIRLVKKGSEFNGPNEYQLSSLPIEKGSKREGVITYIDFTSETQEDC